jgi:hypothetical protein
MAVRPILIIVFITMPKGPLKTGRVYYTSS